MENQEVSISCSKFQKKEQEIGGLTEKINQTQGREKLRWAKELKAEIEPLLRCEDYDQANLECRSCRLISQSRERAAEIVIEVLDLM